MKKILSLLIVGSVFLFSLSTFHSASAQLSINAAYIHQEHTFNYQNGNLDSLMGHIDYMNGGMMGLSLNAPLIGQIGIAPGAYLSFAQAKTLTSDTTSFSTSNLTLKVPFYLNFKISLSEHADLLVFGGPVFNVGISKLSDFRNVADQVDLHTDMGATIGAGIQLSRFRIFVGYNIDMIDKEDFSLANKESVKKAWEGATLFAGIGLSLGSVR